MEKAPDTARLEYIGTVAAANSTHRTSSHGLMSTAPSHESPHLDELPSDRPDKFARSSAGVRPTDYDDTVEAGHDVEDGFDAESSEDYASYRSLSPTAVVSCALGVGSFVAFFDWWLVLIPVMGIVLGLFALRRIAARSEELSGRLPAAIGVALSAVCLVAGQATLWYIRVTEVPDGHIRISYNDLQPPERSVAEYPESATDFDGKRVFIKGYVLAGNRKDGIRTFILVRDKGDCCFGGNPKLTDRILVQLKTGEAFSYTDRLQKLAGRFHIRRGQAVDVAGRVIYQLEDAEVL